MQTRFGFTHMSLAEFEGWIARQQVARTVLTLQQHHTWSPNYASFSGGNHFELQQGMKRHHVTNNGWGDIGQHFTTFPDGSVITGRPLEQSPACIKGNNANAICVEHLGNFDSGKDAMSPAHRQTIIRMTAAICKRFAIPVNADRVVYHHWYHLDTGARTNGAGNTKTCPGTAFFGGNKVEQAQRSFYPLVRAAMPGGAVPPSPPAGMTYASVITPTLNVRSGPAGSFDKVNTVVMGSVVRVFDSRDGWIRISASRDEWVSGKFVSPVERATVKGDTLNVRNGPAASFTKLAALAKGQEVFIHERREGWCRIGTDQKWVSEEFLRLA